MVLYGKPFKQRLPLRLDTILVPKKFLEIHQSLLDLRDKMFAHTDLDLVEERSLDALNSIVVMVTEGQVKMGTGFIYPTPESTAKYRSLVEELVQKTNYHATKLWKAWDVVAKSNTRYVINIADTSDEILKPITWEAGAPFETADQ